MCLPFCFVQVHLATALRLLSKESMVRDGPRQWLMNQPLRLEDRRTSDMVEGHRVYNE